MGRPEDELLRDIASAVAERDRARAIAHRLALEISELYIPLMPGPTHEAYAERIEAGDEDVVEALAWSPETCASSVPDSLSQSDTADDCSKDVAR